MPRVKMRYNYDDFMRELDEDMDAEIAEFEEKMQKKARKKKKSISEDLKKTINNQEFIPKKKKR